MRRTRILSMVIYLLACSACLVLSDHSASGRNRPGGGGDGTQSPSYQILELDTANGEFEGFPNQISNTGLIVGYVHSMTLDLDSAACWAIDETSGTYKLNLLDGDYASAVNDDGAIVGVRGNDAVYWANPNAMPLVLPAPAGVTSVEATGINKQGVISGWISGVPDSNALATPAVWRVNIEVIGDQSTPVIWGPLILGEFDDATPDYANALSDNNSDGEALVVGASVGISEGDTYFALTWTVTSLPDGTLAAVGPTVLDAAVETGAAGVSNNNAVCGRLYPDAVVWTGGTTYTLDQSASYPNNGGRVSIHYAAALAINDVGTIVGFGVGNGNKAVVWTGVNSPMVLLDDFIRKTSFSVLDLATSVNNQNQIVGHGHTDAGFNMGFVALPK